MSSISRTRAGALVLGATALAACSDTTTAPATTAPTSVPTAAASSALLSNAFTSATPGYEHLSSSYAASGKTGTWAPERGEDHERREGSGRDGDALGFGDFMGGGVDDDFLGGPANGFGRRGPFGGGLTDSSCTFSSATGRVTCAAVTRKGLTYQRSAAYTTASGTAQPAFDSLTTNTVNVQTSVSGTTTFTPRERDGFGEGFGRDSAGARVASATSTVQSASSRTVSGLASGSTQRTVNSTSSGRESTAGVRRDSVKFTSVRVMGDTTTGLVVPVRTSATTGPVYPTAGTVIRSMAATVTFGGQAPTTSTRREVLTYDGSATAKLVITKDGTTKTCTVALPRGRPRCV